MTALELLNISLTRMNESVLTTIEDDTYVARLCRLFFKKVADEATMEEDWKFARKRAELIQDEVSDNLTDYEYMYDLPADCLVPRFLRSEQQYEIEAGKLYTADEEAVLVYTASLVDIEDSGGTDIPVLLIDIPIIFAQAIALRIASQIGAKITDNFGLVSALGQEYVVMLEKTKSYDGMLTPANDDEVVMWEEVQ